MGLERGTLTRRGGGREPEPVPGGVDRLQQGVVNTLFLGRLMDNPQGWPRTRTSRSGGHPVIDTANLYYDGNSQGGIEGGLTTAVSPDVRRAVLGVSGVDYGNVLVQRSTDFAPFSETCSMATTRMRRCTR